MHRQQLHCLSPEIIVHCDEQTEKNRVAHNMYIIETLTGIMDTSGELTCMFTLFSLLYLHHYLLFDGVVFFIELIP